MILQTSRLIDDLVYIANGSVELVERAILECAGSADQADLKDVVAYIVRNSRPPMIGDYCADYSGLTEAEMSAPLSPELADLYRNSTPGRDQS